MSCSSKREESRKDLIVGNWEIPPYIDKASGRSFGGDEKMSFFKDGTFTRIHTGQNLDGTYKFLHDEQQLEMSFNAKSRQEYRLTESEATMLSEIVTLSSDSLSIKIHYGERLSEPYTYAKQNK